MTQNVQVHSGQIEIAFSVVIHFELARLAAGIWDKFSMILDDLEIRLLSKATPVTTEMNAFSCSLAARSTACVFEHCKTGMEFFVLNVR